MQAKGHLALAATPAFAADIDFSQNLAPFDLAPADARGVVSGRLRLSSDTKSGDLALEGKVETTLDSFVHPQLTAKGVAVSMPVDLLQAWYQGGISVFDWTDPKNPKEIAFFDRGPVDSTRMVSGGSWSVYWYNGSIVSSEIARGLDVAELVPSEHLTQNEIDAAKTVRWNQLNAQGQPKIEWPPSFALARAYLDQLERNRCLSTSRINDVRRTLQGAERATGPARTNALSALATQLQQDARGSCDQPKMEMLRKAVMDLQNPVVS